MEGESTGYMDVESGFEVDFLKGPLFAGSKAMAPFVRISS